MKKDVSAWALLTLFLVMNIPLASAQMNHGEHSGPTMNHHQIDERLATGGHFVDGGLEALAAQGIKVVIDLRDQPPRGQKERLEAHGIEWVNIPVVWTDPKPENYAAFAQAMSENEGASILVQCQANYRASAMTYIYRVKDGGIAEDIARSDLNAIWEPNEQWSEFMDTVINDL